MYHFDGAAWARVSLPTESSSYTLSSVWGSGKRDVYATGYDLNGTTGILLHFDGRSWTTVRTTPFYLFRLGGSGRRDVLAVGQSGHVMRFDGRVWSNVAVSTSVGLGAVFAARSRAGWIGGEFGTLFRRTTLRSDDSSEEAEADEEIP